MRMREESFLSANQQYKLSGSVLPFKEWLNREKQKGEVIPKLGVTDVYNDVLKSQIEDDVIEGQLMEKEMGKKDNTFLGLSKPLLMVSGLLIIGAVAYKYYYKK
jgi:hypothetical protein